MILAGPAHAGQRTAIAGCSSVMLVLGYDCSENVSTPAARGQAAARGPGGGAQHEHKRGQARPRAGPRLRWRRVSATKFAHH